MTTIPGASLSDVDISTLASLLPSSILAKDQPLRRVGRRADYPALEELASRFDLSYQYDVAPYDFTITQVPYTWERSVLNPLITKATPTALSINNTWARFVITNSGSLWFDIHPGPFTENGQLTTSPFTTTFVYIPGSPWGLPTRHSVP